MQHIVHIFIGEELVTFRDKFSEIFRQLHPDFEASLFTAISLTTDGEGKFILSPDEKGDSFDGVSIDKQGRQTGLFNFFESLYGRKVTVAHPGNQSMVVMIWAKLYTDKVIDIIRELVSAIGRCESNFHVEIAGFTHDAVSCFIPDPLERQAPDVYRSSFDENIRALRKIRPAISALRLVANKNMNNVSLDLNEDSMARICAEFAAIMCEHYLSIHHTVIDSEEYPFETFGVSSIIFDLEYYKTYIRNKILIDRILQQGIRPNGESPVFNINSLAQKTNPILKSTVDSIHSCYNTTVANATAQLALSGGTTPSDIVGAIDAPIKGLIAQLKSDINGLLTSGKISIFESEALLSLILGDDCTMFDSSSVDADEIIIDDIIDESADFFISLDINKEKLKDVSQKEIKRIRHCMRNIAVANRHRQQQLAALNIQRKDASGSNTHIEGNEYRFGGIGYKLDLNIDTEPLEQTYEPHEVRTENVDLRGLFAPIRNQGKQGSCASFAVSSVIEALRRDHQRYSPAYLYWNARERAGKTSADSGASLYDVIKATTEKGICIESLMPYNQDIFAVAPSEEAKDSARNCKVIEAKTVNTTLSDIKSALEDGYPVLVASRIFDSFSETQSGFIKHPSGKELSSGDRKDGHGNHAMVVCGFSDKEKIFVVRNSWGTDFGDKGYCYIPYTYAQKYFLQACIITKVTDSGQSERNMPGKQTINFNLNDSNIQAAILQNLIVEDNHELEELAVKSAGLRSDWAQNIATLGNVNNQAELVAAARRALDEQIFEENCIISDLQSSMNDKISAFKKSYIIQLIKLGSLTLVSWVLLYFFYRQKWSWFISGVLTLLFIGLFTAYEYNWRKYCQDLRDEIQLHADKISEIQAKKTGLGIRGHIHGTILKEAENYRIWLQSQTQKLHNFNDSVLKLFKSVNKELGEMTPEVPYPFRAVLTNDRLDKYYDRYKDKMLDSIMWAPIFAGYETGNYLSLIIKENSDLNNAVIRGLRNFTMKHYVTLENRDKWPFLPDTANISEIIPDLDNRAIPFCPYNPQGFNALENYIFIHDITPRDMNPIRPYFSQAPLAISGSNPYSISILNIVRYNLPN